MSYDEVRAKLAETYGWTFEQIDDMSFEQINSAIRGGKKPEGAQTRSLDEAVAMAKDMRENWRKYYGI